MLLTALKEHLHDIFNISRL